MARMNKSKIEMRARKRALSLSFSWDFRRRAGEGGAPSSRFVKMHKKIRSLDPDLVQHAQIPKIGLKNLLGRR